MPKKAHSETPGVQSLIDSDPKFARVFSMAKANGLPDNLDAGYADVYLDNGYQDLGIATKLLGDMTWAEYLQEQREEYAQAIVEGESKRAKELGLDSPPKTEPTPRSKAVPEDTGETVTAKQGDAYRKVVRQICDEFDWELSETGGAIMVKCQEGTVLAQAAYRRGTKNNAWKQVHDELEILT